MDQQQKSQQMEKGRIPKLLAQLAVPAVVAQLVNLLYTIVDRIYIGHMAEVGATALTGVGLFMPILMLINAFAMLAGAGGAPLAAIRMGRKEHDFAEKILGNCFTVLMIFAVALTVIFYVAAPTLLQLFGASQVTLPYALSYSRKDKSSVYFISDAEHGSGLEQGEIQEITATMENFLRGGMAEDLEIYLDDLEKKLRNGGKNTLVLSTILLTEIGAAVYKVIYMAIGECGVEVLQKKYSMQQMREMERMAENFQIIKMLCMEAKKMLMDQRKKSSEVICEQAVQIIQDRYAQQDLSVMIISEEIGVSPNYLSSLIKKTTGSSLVEILTKKRIEKAMELLQCTGMKIGEITELCGYKDQYYFSHCFKKLTGVSPNKYRREHEQA